MDRTSSHKIYRHIDIFVECFVTLMQCWVSLICFFVSQPDSGRLEAFRVPGGPGVRLDGAVSTGSLVSRHYDSLICKVVCSAPTFLKAAQKMQRALNEFQVYNTLYSLLYN